jgi:hypothetical protein
MELGEMPFCTKCGAQLDEDSKFCDACGEPAQPVQTQVAEPEPVAGSMMSTEYFKGLFDAAVARNRRLFESGPFRFFAALVPNPVPRDSEAKLTFVCKNVEDKSARVELLFKVPRNKGLCLQTTNKDKMVYKSDFNPNEVKGCTLPMVCTPNARTGTHPLEIWVDYKYTGQAVVRALVGSRKRGVRIKAGIV